MKVNITERGMLNEICAACALFCLHCKLNIWNLLQTPTNNGMGNDRFPR